MSEELIAKSKRQEEIDSMYLNRMQILAYLVDSNMLFAEVARGTGKTDGITGPRAVRCGYELAGETIALGHATYMALMSNIVPKLLTYFRTPRGKLKKPMLQEGIHYVVGTAKLPKHFQQTRQPIINPKHSIVFFTGAQIRLVSTDQPESVAGADIAHAIIEEMKHNKGDKLKSRVFPALRGGSAAARQSHLYGGVTGVSDTARVDLGEDDWFFDYEKAMDKNLIAEILTVAMHVDKAHLNIKLGKEVAKNQRRVERWGKILRQQRKIATFYLRASSFANKEILGLKYFQNQLKTLTTDEFLSSIANIRVRRVADMFFGYFNKNKHTYSDGYKYDTIHEFSLANTFKITCHYLKYLKPTDRLILGYDPGHFSSLVVGTVAGPRKNVLRIHKEHFVYHPKSHADLAKDFHDFWSDHPKRNIDLYYDRAGNQRKQKYANLTAETDAKQLKEKLDALGWRVTLKNRRQRTIFHYEHFNLFADIWSGKPKTPEVLIDENGCPNLVSAIYLSPLKRTYGIVELDKTSELKVPLQHQAGLTTQIPSAMMYLVFSLFERYAKQGSRSSTPLPDTNS